MRRIRYLFQIALRMIRELSTVDLVQTKQVNLSPDETRRLVSDGNPATYTALARQGTCCVNCAILLGTGAILQCCYFFYFVLTRGKGQLVTLILFCFSKSSFHFLTTRMPSGGVSKHPTPLFSATCDGCSYSTRFSTLYFIVYLFLQEMLQAHCYVS